VKIYGQRAEYIEDLRGAISEVDVHGNKVGRRAKAMVDTEDDVGSRDRVAANEELG